MRGTHVLLTLGILVVGATPGTARACPTCVGKVSKTSPAFFEDACYQQSEKVAYRAAPNTTEHKNTDTAVPINTTTPPEEQKEEESDESYE